MELPSGRTLDAYDHMILRLMAEYGFIRWSDELIPFRSGVKSHVYVGGREDVTHHPDLLQLLGLKTAQAVEQEIRAHPLLW